MLSNTGWGQWSNVGCTWNAWLPRVLPQKTIYIPKNMQPGSVFNANGWDALVYVSGKACAFSKVNMLGLGENDVISGHLTLPVGSKPVGNMTVPIDGQVFPVFTTPELEPLGVGYVLRFRARKNNESVFDYQNPPWTVVSNHAASKISNGFNFYKTFFQAAAWPVVCPLGDGQPHWGVQKDDGVESFQEYLDIVNSAPNGFPGCIFFVFKIDVQFKYVLIQQMGDVLDYSTLNSVVFDVATVSYPPALGGGGNGQAKISHSLKITYSPQGTCTTGNVLVPFGAVNQTQLPSVGSTSTPKPFAIELTNCPRVNIGYSFVAPNGIGMTAQRAWLIWIPRLEMLKALASRYATAMILYMAATRLCSIHLHIPATQVMSADGRNAKRRERASTMQAPA